MSMWYSSHIYEIQLVESFKHELTNSHRLMNFSARVVVILFLNSKKKGAKHNNSYYNGVIGFLTLGIPQVCIYMPFI